MPGIIIQNLRKAGTRNCVMMLDEVDKLGAGGFHGDPASALLEVLDPEQNATFRDTYLAVPFDLSQVMFICTANVLDTIPGPLRDRMEIIQLPGYTAQEKLQIARRYLVPRQLEANGLDAERCEITDAALMAIIEDYTREAGVRNLEREIGSVFRNVAVRIAEGSVRRRQIDASRPARDPRRREVRSRSRDAQRHPRRRDRPRVDAGRRRHPVHRSDAHARHGTADPHRPARRRDEGKRAGGAVAGQGARGQARHQRPRPWRSRTSTSTCRRARRRRTDRARGSRCSSR